MAKCIRFQWGNNYRICERKQNFVVETSKPKLYIVSDVLYSSSCVYVWVGVCVVCVCVGVCVCVRVCVCMIDTLVLTDISCYFLHRRQHIRHGPRQIHQDIEVKGQVPEGSYTN